MSDNSWLIQIYEMTELASQEAALELLSGSAGIKVEARQSDCDGAFLIIECEPSQALAMYELVMMADADAELVHSTEGQDKSDLVGTFGLDSR